MKTAGYGARAEDERGGPADGALRQAGGHPHCTDHRAQHLTYASFSAILPPRTRRTSGRGRTPGYRAGPLTAEPAQHFLSKNGVPIATWPEDPRQARGDPTVALETLVAQLSRRSKKRQTRMRAMGGGPARCWARSLCSSGDWRAHGGSNGLAGGQAPGQMAQQRALRQHRRLVVAGDGAQRQAEQRRGDMSVNLLVVPDLVFARLGVDAKVEERLPTDKAA